MNKKISDNILLDAKLNVNLLLSNDIKILKDKIHSKKFVITNLHERIKCRKNDLHEVNNTINNCGFEVKKEFRERVLSGLIKEIRTMKAELKSHVYTQTKNKRYLAVLSKLYRQFYTQNLKTIYGTIYYGN